MLLGLVLVCAARAGLMEYRVQEAHMHMRFLLRLPFNASRLPALASFSQTGWATPGVFPAVGDDTHWVNDVPSTSYLHYYYPQNICIQKLRGLTVETCYRHVVSSFWWGAPIKLNHELSCAMDRCNFTISTRPLLLRRRFTSKYRQEGDPLGEKKSFPPRPWHLHSSLSSRLLLAGEVLDYSPGYFWYKPLFWASCYAVSRMFYYPTNTTALSYQATFLSPVSRADHIEGIFGYHADKD